MSTLINNGQMMNSDGTIEKRDLLIKDGIITSIAEEIVPAPDMNVIDATDLLISPGFIDLHVHLREPGFAKKKKPSLPERWQRPKADSPRSPVCLIQNRFRILSQF